MYASFIFLPQCNKKITFCLTYFCIIAFTDSLPFFELQIIDIFVCYFWQNFEGFRAFKSQIN